MSATQISKAIGMPKTSVYRQLEVLVEKGFVVTEKTDSGDKFSAEIDILASKAQDWVEESRRRLEKVDLLKSSLKTIQKEDFRGADFKVYKGLNGVKQIVWNTLEAKNTIYFYTSAYRKKLFGDTWFKRYLSEFTKRKIYEKGFEVTHAAKEGYPFKSFELFPDFLKFTEVKFVKDITLNGEVTIYNDTYSMFNWQNDQLIGFEIIDPSFVKMQRSTFEKLWEKTDSVAYFKRGKFIPLRKGNRTPRLARG